MASSGHRTQQFSWQGFTLQLANAGKPRKKEVENNEIRNARTDRVGCDQRHSDAEHAEQEADDSSGYGSPRNARGQRAIVGLRRLGVSRCSLGAVAATVRSQQLFLTCSHRSYCKGGENHEIRNA